MNWYVKCVCIALSYVDDDDDDDDDTDALQLKREEKKRWVRDQKRATLKFGTKLGMHSPV